MFIFQTQQSSIIIFVYTFTRRHKIILYVYRLKENKIPQGVGCVKDATFLSLQKMARLFVTT